MAFDPLPARRPDGRMRAMPGPETAPKRCRRAAPLLEAASSVPDRQTSIDDKLGLLWGALQFQLLELLTHGAASPFQRRAFDRLDYSMKQYGKLRLERADEMRGEKLGEPDADEIATILDKMDRRIDALAEERFKKLAGGKLHGAGADGRGAGMDV